MCTNSIEGDRKNREDNNELDTLYSSSLKVQDTMALGQVKDMKISSVGVRRKSSQHYHKSTLLRFAYLFYE